MMKIKNAREAKGWTQERLAVKMSTTQQTIQRWETGQTDVKSAQLKQLSRILGVTVSYLLGIEEKSSEFHADITSADERELLALYRRMEPSQKLAIMEVARSMAVASEKDGAGIAEHEKVAR